MNTAKDIHKLYTGISTKTPSVIKGSIQPWPKLPSGFHLTLTTFFFISIWLIFQSAISFITPSNFNYWQRPTNAKVLLLYVPNNQLDYAKGFDHRSDGYSLNPTRLHHAYAKLLRYLDQYRKGTSLLGDQAENMSGRRGKREKPSSPGMRAGAASAEGEISSPPKTNNKRIFTGEKAMDEDFEPVREDGLSEEDAKQAEKTQEDGAEETKEADDEGFKLSERELRKKACQARIAEQKRTSRRPKDKDKPAKETTSRGRSKSADPPNRSRSASAPRKRSVSSSHRRSTSVESTSTKEDVDNLANDEEKEDIEDTAKATPKSASFAEGIPDNTGKTASTRKEEGYDYLRRQGQGS